MDSKLKRGCLVNGIFILSILGSIIKTCSFFINKFTAKLDPSLTSSNTSIAITTLMGAIYLVVLIGAWFWNQMCIYAILPVNLISIVYNLSTQQIITGRIIGYIINILINCFFVYSLLKIQKLRMEQSFQCN
ncbi:hypothetical protein [Clostridium scatologenes]|uniref:Uncharacterized protein n=1 Tax=Clostridium scatologenes TaxID=1548 RepID=A0A0E3M594_CLOSL|nr:hypothetical protein [Clostridium scatologenes]AKA68175.1 hypothetical protein CSCA_1050 [Clostridium scatologenes]